MKYSGRQARVQPSAWQQFGRRSQSWTPDRKAKRLPLMRSWIVDIAMSTTAASTIVLVGWAVAGSSLSFEEFAERYQTLIAGWFAFVGASAAAGVAWKGIRNAEQHANEALKRQDEVLQRQADERDRYRLAGLQIMLIAVEGFGPPLVERKRTLASENAGVPIARVMDSIHLGKQALRLNENMEALGSLKRPTQNRVLGLMLAASKYNRAVTDAKAANRADSETWEEIRQLLANVEAEYMEALNRIRDDIDALRSEPDQF